MRAIVNISLPKPLFDVVETTIAHGEYASRSEFFRSLLRLWMSGQLRSELDQSRNELERGKGKVLKSLKDLR